MLKKASFYYLQLYIIIIKIKMSRVNLSEYMAAPLTIEEALKELQKIKEDKMKGKN